MKRPAAVIGFIVLSLVLSIPASGQKENFSGKWILNTEKSDSKPRVTPIGRAASPKMQTSRTPSSHPPFQNPQGSKNPPATIPSNAKIPATTPAGGMRGGGIGQVYGGATFDGLIPVADDVPLVINQTDTQIHIVNTLRVNGNKVPNSETYTLDGEKYEETIQGRSGAELKREIQSSLKKNKITIEIVTFNPTGRMLRRTGEFSLSKDGRTLTVKLSSQSQYSISSQKKVYDKE